MFKFEEGKAYKQENALTTVYFRVAQRGRKYLSLYSFKVDFNEPVDTIDYDTPWQIRNALVDLYKITKVDMTCRYEFTTDSFGDEVIEFWDGRGYLKASKIVIEEVR